MHGCLLLVTAAVLLHGTAAMEATCQGDGCAAGEDSSMMQLRGDTGRKWYVNPCPEGTEPKQSEPKLCEAAGFKYVGNKDAVQPEQAQQCCVPTSWLCANGDSTGCVSDKQATVAWLDPNCCLQPKPSSATKPSWGWEADGREKDCKSQKMHGKDYTIAAFWTGEKCVTSAEGSNSHGPWYKPTKCKRMSEDKCKKKPGLWTGHECCYYHM